MYNVNQISQEKNICGRLICRRWVDYAVYRGLGLVECMLCIRLYYGQVYRHQMCQLPEPNRTDTWNDSNE